jgi:hypothetical protein
MPGGGAREQAPTADYNAEMIEQIARFPLCGTAPCSSATPVMWSRTGSATTCPPSATGGSGVGTGLRPFTYVPLRHHFEQNFHVRHRLGQYGAGRCLDYDQTGLDALAELS